MPRYFVAFMLALQQSVQTIPLISGNFQMVEVLLYSLSVILLFYLG